MTFILFSFLFSQVEMNTIYHHASLHNLSLGLYTIIKRAINVVLVKMVDALVS